MSDQPSSATIMSRSASGPFPSATETLSTSSVALPIEGTEAVVKSPSPTPAPVAVAKPAHLPAIPMSRERFWNEFRSVFLPFIVFAASLALAIWLWRTYLAAAPLGG